MDVANALMQNAGFDWKFTRDVSMLFGLATCAVAVWVDVRSRPAQEPAWRQDYAFWLYLFGAIMFWCGLSLRDSNSEWAKFFYALLNVFLVFVGAVIGRRVFTVLGALGVAGYLGYLSHRVFKDSLMFPFALTLLGLGVVALGIRWQRHEVQINARLSAWVPTGLRS
jgi:glucose-6-phosphate-specific signal transduction histidine kinase